MNLFVKFLYMFSRLFALGLVFDLIIPTEYPMSIMAQFILSGVVALLSCLFDIYQKRQERTKDKEKKKILLKKIGR